MGVADDGIFTFEKDDYKFTYHQPTARDLLRVRFEHALLIQEKRRKMAKHVEDAEKTKDPKAIDLHIALQVSDASDFELEYFAAAIIEPKISILELGNLPGDVFEALSIAFTQTIRKGERLKFRLFGPGIPEDETAGAFSRPRGDDESERVHGRKMERPRSDLVATESRG